MALSKLTSDQRDEIARRYIAGESQYDLAKEFGVSQSNVQKLCQARNAIRPPEAAKNRQDMAEFVKRAHSVLWRQDHGKEKPTYDAWKARVAALESEEGGGYDHNQAVVRASKEFPCLHILFREYDLRQYDPNPESHAEIRYYGKTPGMANLNVEVQSEGKDLPYRENLRWALDAAGAYRRTMQHPATTPNDAAWYLYCQAIQDAKEFLSRVGQIESKGDSESEASRNSRKSGKKMVDEINRMLDELDREDEDED